jgi:hypothetical protein
MEEAIDSFTRQYLFAATFLIPIFFLEIFWAHWRIFVCLPIALALLYSVEGRVADALADLSASSEFHFTRPLSLLLSGAFSLFVAALVCPFLRTIPATGIVTTYLFGVLESALIFLCAAGAKAMLLGSRIVSYRLARRGFFGLLERVAVAVRNAAVTAPWVAYFLAESRGSLLGALTGPQNFFSLAYLLVKCFLQLWLLFDFGSAITAYHGNAEPTCVSVPAQEEMPDCIVCLDKPSDPVRFDCGHIFCRECAMEWLAQSRVCPLCRRPVVEAQEMDFEDGALSIGLFFFAV